MRQSSVVPSGMRCIEWLMLSTLTACGPHMRGPGADSGSEAPTTCIDLPSGTSRPEFGCFNVAAARGLRFDSSSVYWHLRAFPTRAAAEAARSPAGLVVEEEGRVWLSEFGPPDASFSAGEAIAVVGPLKLPPAETFNAVLSFAVMQPGQRSMIHSHPGPEGWYLLAGEQCVLTPSGAKYAAAGESMTTPPDVPIELRVTGTTTRRALLVVIHDAAKPRTIPSAWKPSAGCGD